MFTPMGLFGEEQMSDDNLDAMLDAQDIAKALKMPLSTVYQRAKENALPFESIYIGRSLRFRRHDVRQFLRRPDIGLGKE